MILMSLMISITYFYFLQMNLDYYKLILVVRTDLKMGKGKVAAQCAHAAVAAYKAVENYPEVLHAWERSGQAKITVKVDSDSALKEIAKQAVAVGLLANTIKDAGHTQVKPGSRTVCAIGPGPAKLIDQVTGHLKLF
ncbi:Peptidyl-tRNA hydrolase protein 2, mitochondrial, variant 2 [Melipona bicolor]|uniref:peptidyl-tRNA hydrolase n=1 Tax=Melipona bicolor TaxID=60889 RepID=A0AA40KX43_9HYME|nr:Peptidyl-tRNA hydrolase protein 2, mitochondrial, variant 2 [Melipona bicolor]